VFAQATVLNYTHSGLNQDFLDLVTTLYDIYNNFKFGILVSELQNVWLNSLQGGGIRLSV